jgi:hypothetical protein
MVFWCAHASRSDWVQTEYNYGIELNREICPVLLDGTELAGPLKEFQWLDLRDSIGRHVDTAKQTLTADEVQRTQQAHRLGKQPWELDSDEADHFDYTRKYRSDANLFREGWVVEPGGGASRVVDSIRRPSSEELLILTERLTAWLDQR